MAKRPNFLIFIVDELRHQTGYESPELRAWLAKNLKFQNELKSTSTIFNRHYIGSTACMPSRALIQTGQYPETNGVWTDPIDGSTGLKEYTCPTIGNYFESIGYITRYVGKWHVSNISIKGENGKGILSFNNEGLPLESIQNYYLEQDVMKPYGYHDWIGPDPTIHGTNLALNSGSSAAKFKISRDPKFTTQVQSQLRSLKDKTDPWLLFASYINPHDITAFGDLSINESQWNFEIDPTLPDNIFTDDFLPSRYEDLSTKPEIQTYYRDHYGALVQPISPAIANQYYKLYYSLLAKVDKQMYKVWHEFKKSDAYQNTIVLFMSDHGDLLGSHSYLHQKLFVGYEEVVHVPLMIHSPLFDCKRGQVNTLTSHIDILPTLLSLAGSSPRKIEKIRLKLSNRFKLALPLPGKDFSPLIKGYNTNAKYSNNLIYFYTYDAAITQSYRSPICTPIKPIPVIHCLDMIVYQDDKGKFWKLTRYFDKNNICPLIYVGKILNELYDLDNDPYEVNNLALNSKYDNIKSALMVLLENQSLLHRYTP